MFHYVIIYINVHNSVQEYYKWLDETEKKESLFHTPDILTFCSIWRPFSNFMLNVLCYCHEKYANNISNSFFFVCLVNYFALNQKIPSRFHENSEFVRHPAVKKNSICLTCAPLKYLYRSNFHYNVNRDIS